MRKRNRSVLFHVVRPLDLKRSYSMPLLPFPTARPSRRKRSASSCWLSIIVKDVVVVVVVVVAHHGRVKLCFFWCCWCRDDVLVLLAKVNFGQRGRVGKGVEKKQGGVDTIAKYRNKGD